MADPTEVAGVAVDEDLVSEGPKVVPAPRAELRLDWFWEADMVMF